MKGIYLERNKLGQRVGGGAYELRFGHVEFKRPVGDTRKNFDRHLDVWIWRSEERLGQR